MPLIVITGYPCSGKTRRTNQLKTFFEEQGKEVHVIDENELILNASFEKNNYYQDSKKEKHIRGLVKSEALKLISPRNVVIIDGPNYIKGYRYELFCGMKANHSTQCTIRSIMNQDEAWRLNENRPDAEKYERKTFDGLIMRYEEPDGKNRWDAPLFTVFSDDELDLKAVSDCLFEKKAPPPNLSTQNAPLSSTNFLYDLNKIVNQITMELIVLVNNGCDGEVPLSGYGNLRINLKKATVQQIIDLSKQYITYSKLNTPEINQVPQLYVQYLITHLV